jgi:hypothetical protein
MRTGFDFAWYITRYWHNCGSTSIPEPIINVLSGHPEGRGTYRKEPDQNMNFGFELYGDFIKPPEKNEMMATIQVTKGGFRVTEPSGRTSCYMDFNVTNEGHEIAHFHPYANQERWDLHSDFDRILSFLENNLSVDFRIFLNENGRDNPAILRPTY